MQQPPQSSAQRRWIKRIAICVILGAVLQYLVAATFGLRTSWGDSDQTWMLRVSDHGRTSALLVTRHPAIGRTILAGYLAAENTGYGGSRQVDGTADWSQGEWVDEPQLLSGLKIRGNGVSGTPSGWSRFARATKDPSFRDFAPTHFGTSIEVGCGWPMCSASYSAKEEYLERPYVVINGVEIASSTATVDSTPRVIPLEIYWPGALANTGVYGSVCLLFWLLIATARTAERKRCGRCPACNYDLRATTTGACPECGATLKTGSAESAVT